MKALDLLEPGRLLGGVLIQELLDKQQSPITSGTRVGAYRIVRELGRIGTGRVYLAEREDDERGDDERGNDEFRRQVALRFLVAVGSAISVELFRRQRQLLVEQHHSDQTRLIDRGHDDRGQHWLAMELIEGSSFDQHFLHTKPDV